MRFCEAPNCHHPVFGTCKKSRKGYCKSHQSLREDFDRRSITQKAIDKHKVNKKLNSLKGTPENKELVEKEKSKRTVIGDWYLDRRKEMCGVCCECGKTTSRGSDKYFTWSICHIVPKSLVPSVATHEHNWIELCQQHHQEFDSTFDKAEKMMCFGEVKQKFQLFKHLIPNEQLRKINPHLLK